MIICLPADGDNENTQVSGSFGRCPYYAFYDTESDRFEIVRNPATNAMGGAGIQAAQFIVNRGTKVVLTVNMGPNSGEVLKEAGIKIITGVTGTLREAVERYKNGEFANVPENVVYSEPKHEHGHVEETGALHSYPKNTDLSEEIKGLKEAVEVLKKRTQNLINRIEKLETDKK
jgi:predicted Fe-Mo cluster-binding NifX family protein